MTPSATERKLLATFPTTNPVRLKLALDRFRTARSFRQRNEAFNELGLVLDGVYGEEALRSKRPGNPVVAYYLNTGETYNTTLIWFVTSNHLAVTSVGNVVESRRDIE